MDAYEFAKHGLLPGSLGFLFVCLCVALAAARFRRTAVSGWRAAALLIAIYWCISMPAGAWMLQRIVAAGYEPVMDSRQFKEVSAIVVLDAATDRYGGHDTDLTVLNRASAVRAAEVLRLYHMLRPSLVVVTAGARTKVGRTPEGEAMRGGLQAAGIPAEHLALDSYSRNTAEHPLNVGPLLKERGISRFALVTSAVHMRRAMRAFEAAGMRPYPAPAPIEEPGRFGWWPSTEGLDRSLEAMREVFGLLRDLAVHAAP